MSRELLNTLFIMKEGANAHLNGDTVEVTAEGRRLLQVPLLHLGSVVLFGATSMTHQLMMRCAADGRAVTLLDYSGRFRARVVGPTSGNVLLRKAQYDTHASSDRSRDIARSIVGAKIRNARQNIARGARDTEDADTEASLREATASLDSLLRSLPEADTVDAIRGIEGQAAAVSFGVFGRLILRDKAEFAFTVRTRRPPRDRVNALLSFLYTLLQGDCTAALEGVGLDPQFGFLHALRPGRPALALDLMEEFRPCIADRLALTLINRRQINPAQFEEHEKGAVLLNEEGRKIVLTEYQKRKQEEVRHPFLKETTPLGLVPHLQARLLARHLRGDLPSYSPFTVR
ncbi:MAG: type I-C CRISPR-associated endonuclease Cas1 [Chthonomonadales bacterium]|nr:type I-C CRISPR-associated endonuclease Cas1 [Chthonomonadales bacterium]